MEWLVNLIMRGILGILAIHFINVALSFIGISLGVGINFFTIGVMAILGLPGLLVLYGFGLYQLL
ncbi:MAG: pro-sigmaK processing inhibitor BofA family protein [Acetatifactor sp.]